MKPIIALLLLTTSAAAQQPHFVPFTIDEPTFNQLMTALGEVPAKYSLAIIATLQQHEAAASTSKSVPTK